LLSDIKLRVILQAVDAWGPELLSEEIAAALCCASESQRFLVLDRLDEPQRREVEDLLSCCRFTWDDT
jgi:hypothetical protein